MSAKMLRGILDPSGTLSETNSEFTPENGWLEDDPFLMGWPIFRGYVSFRECIF